MEDDGIRTGQKRLKVHVVSKVISREVRERIVGVDVQNLEHVFHQDLNQLLPVLSDPRSQVDAIVLGASAMEPDGGTDLHDALRMLRTLIKVVGHMEEDGSIRPRKTQIIVHVPVDIPAEEAKSLLSHEHIDGVMIRPDLATPEEIMEYEHDMIEGTPHVPARIKERLRQDHSNLQLHHRFVVVPHTDIGFIKRTRPKVTEAWPIQYHHCETMSDLFAAVSDHQQRMDSILIDIESLEDTDGTCMMDMLNTLDTLLKCSTYQRSDGKSEVRKVHVGVTVTTSTDPRILREAMRTPQVSMLINRDVIPDDELRRIIDAVLNQANYVSDSVKAMLHPKKAKKIRQKDGIYLTPRQQQVLNLICSKGASNKVIARALKLSESTVKLHIGSILKKHGLTNRTQLALFAKKDK